MAKNQEKKLRENVKNILESVDPRLFLAYNRSMKESTRKKWRAALRILLPIVCVALLAFIFGNSLKTGEQSSKQSSTVVNAVQTVAGWIAPDSALATATGAAYDHLHAWVRVIAHFLEFGALGAAMTWCCLSYSLKKTVFNFSFFVDFGRTCHRRKHTDLYARARGRICGYWREHAWRGLRRAVCLYSDGLDFIRLAKNDSSRARRKLLANGVR